MKRLCMMIVCCMLVGCSVQEHSTTLLPKQSALEVKKNPPPFFIPRSMKIVALGDSLTEGIGDGENRGGYVGRVEQSLKDDDGIRDLDVVNFGVKGHKTTDLLKRLTEKKVKSQLKEADIVVMSIGGNDMMKIVRGNILSLDFNVFRSEEILYEKRLGTIIKEIRKNNKYASIYFVGLYNPFKYMLSELTEIDKVVAEWNEGTKKLLGNDGNAYFVPIADIFSLESEENLLYKDAFHPNEAGYSLIAERVHDAMFE